jgi:LPS sulfotransferase NodH
VKNIKFQNIRGEFKRVRGEIFSYLLALFKKTKEPDSKFIIFSKGRTGSNLLRTLLNSHPEIVCEGDIFLRLYVRILSLKLYIKGRIAKNPTNVYGFQLKLTQLERQKIDAKQFLSYLHENGWKIIYLSRKNLFRRIISAKVANSRHQWLYHDSKSGSDYSTSFKIHLDGEKLLTSLEKAEISELKDKALLEQLPYLEIFYEDDLLKAEQHQKTADKIFDFLGVQSASIETNMVRTPYQNLAEVIENYDEIAALLSKTKYAHYLEED